MSFILRASLVIALSGVCLLPACRLRSVPTSQEAPVSQKAPMRVSEYLIGFLVISEERRAQAILESESGVRNPKRSIPPFGSVAELVRYLQAILATHQPDVKMVEGVDANGLRVVYVTGTEETHRLMNLTIDLLVKIVKHQHVVQHPMEDETWLRMPNFLRSPQPDRP